MNTAPQKNSKVSPKKEVGVMDVMKKDRGMNSGERLNSVQVIQKFFQNQGAKKEDFEMFVKKLYVFLKEPGKKLLQVNNSVFLLTLVSPGVVEVNVLTIDPPNVFGQSLQGMVKALKNQGVKKIYGYSNTTQYLDVMKQTGIPFKTNQSEKVMNGTAVPVLTFEADI